MLITNTYGAFPVKANLNSLLNQPQSKEKASIGPDDSPLVWFAGQNDLAQKPKDVTSVQNSYYDTPLSWMPLQHPTGEQLAAMHGVKLNKSNS